MRHLILLMAVAVAAAATRASAESPRIPRVYDQLDATFEAEQRFEGRRQLLIDRQLWLNDEMVWWTQPFPGWGPWNAPWPFVPGDILGYPLPPPLIDQPVGRVESQVGPNTWFSRPIHADELAPQPLDATSATLGPREF